MITSAQQFSKLDPTNGVLLQNGDTIPIVFNSVEWHPSEIDRIELVGEYETPKGLRTYRQSGLGIPLLCHVKPQRRFTHSESVFVATGVLRPIGNGGSGSVLEIVNTLKLRDLPINGHTIPLAVDTTAPLGYLNTFAERLGITGLLKPAQAKDQYGLRMIEPYQPGKIPVIFIHGLASDPLTWGSMANDVFMNQDIVDQFQFWTFSYPTGAPFPFEAANLRQQLVELRDHVDPNRIDPALDNIVLIGHSMGGLVSKMQITSSQDQLIRSMSKVPIEQLHLQPETRANLEQLFSFSPSTQISRVVFIGTPHQGSNLAKGVASRLASRFIRQPEEIVDVFEEIRANNKRLLTSRMRRMPTSVDLLRPDNTLTQAIFRLPVNPNVSVHSIIGVGHGGKFGFERSDGIVPYSSARHPGAESELTVDAGHSLHNHQDSTAEVVRILRLHARRTLVPHVQHYSNSMSAQPATGLYR